MGIFGKPNKFGWRDGEQPEARAVRLANLVNRVRNDMGVLPWWWSGRSRSLALPLR